MKVIYVIGPYSAPDSWAREQNIRRAESLALLVNSWGHAAICVHAESRFYFGAVPESHAIAADLEILGRCDGALVADGWDASRGSIGEIAYALAKSIPVFMDQYNCHTWCDGPLAIYDPHPLGEFHPQWNRWLVARERFGAAQ